MATKNDKAKAAGTAAVAVKPAGGKPAERGERSLFDWPLANWEREIEDWFDDLRGRLRLPAWSGRDASSRGAGLTVKMPALDLIENDAEIVAKVEVPGMSKDDIEVSLSDGTLSIRGEKKEEKESKEGDYHCSERVFGSFARRVRLPAAIKADDAKASFKDGVLEVRIPKAAESKPKAVKVRVS